MTTPAPVTKEQHRERTLAVLSAARSACEGDPDATFAAILGALSAASVGHPLRVESLRHVIGLAATTLVEECGESKDDVLTEMLRSLVDGHVEALKLSVSLLSFVVGTGGDSVRDISTIIAAFMRLRDQLARSEKREEPS